MYIDVEIEYLWLPPPALPPRQHSQYLCGAVIPHLHRCARVAVLPRSVRISPAPALVAGRGCTVECVVSGASPRPAVTWLLNGETYNTVEYVSVTAEYKVNMIHRHPFLSLRYSEQFNKRFSLKTLGFVWQPKVSLKYFDDLTL